MRLLLLVFILLSSCSIQITDSKYMQKNYQDKLVHDYSNGMKVKLFNPIILKNLIDSNVGINYFIIVPNSTFCSPTLSRFKKLKKICEQNDKDSVYFIPLIHDNSSSLRNLLDSPLNYNKKNEFFVTDFKFYKKQALNSSIGYRNNFLYKFSDTFVDGKNIFFRYNNKIVILQSHCAIYDTMNFKDVFKNSVEIYYKL